MASMDKRDQSNPTGCPLFTGSLQKWLSMLSQKAWAYGLGSISGCKAALEGSLNIICEEGLAALWGFMYKGVTGSLFCTAW